ncbi:MAG: DUF1667 domain-containing protein [Kiritimatiellaeota bacterium]|nr:DUF1667 domain-containing protein [Kiritimatiellota bacterium]
MFTGCSADGDVLILRHPSPPKAEAEGAGEVMLFHALTRQEGGAPATFEEFLQAQAEAKAPAIAGAKYAEEECVAPKRMVTTLVRVAGRRAPLSVKTAAPVPKEKIFDVLAAVHSAQAAPPARIGDVVLADVCGTGVDILATSAV